MKHAGRAALVKLSPILARIRSVPGLKERSRGVFYLAGKAFLHFHEDPKGLFADVRRGAMWERFPVGDRAGRGRLRRLIASLCLLAAVGPARGAAGVEGLGWLTGCWEEKSPEGIFEEYWTAPAGKTLLQMGRMTAGGRTMFYETLQVREEDGRLALLVTINGKRQVEFEAAEISDRKIVFKTLPGAAPESLSYERVSRNVLYVRLEKTRDGKPSVSEFRLRRADCRRSLSGKP